MDKAKQGSFDLILSDIHMPEMGGVEAISQLLDLDIHTPAIALTANAMKHEVERYLNKGFTDHLSKPIQREEFIRKLALYLSDNDADKDDYQLQLNVKERLAEQFRQSIPGRLEVLENAFFAQDWRAITLLAHSLKGATSSFSLHHLSELCSNIEALAIAVQQDERQANQLAELLLQLKDELEKSGI